MRVIEVSREQRRNEGAEEAALSGTSPTCENPEKLKTIKNSYKEYRVSEEIWTALNIEVLIEVSMEQRRNEEPGETGDPRENPPTNGIIRHDSYMQKIPSDAAGD
ncbi:hypothetical protein PR048_023295 [Dryococelus australis]|uniref:Uncharacterized protein n=1 Tax=Dryococelus australis TaxID=614101 RepID=A0ABQ9GTQ1_9NEOP|nr:hypothetical protein PR048_023295 [Dryococelus australis]